MNNSQFRKLVLDTPARPSGIKDNQPTPRRDGATPSTLGSRMRSSIPMTPRSVGGVDFARQLAEERASASTNDQAPRKKFRSTAAPKGAKLPTGYVDRSAHLRKEEEEEEVGDDDKASRVKALEEMMKLQQIDEVTFRKLRDEILGGDVGSTHLVKGLDYKLLARVRAGEDVLSGNGEGERDEEEEQDIEAVDDELNRLEDREFTAVEKEKKAKKGEMAPPSLMPGRKRNRDQILAELRASRQAAKEAAQPSLGAKFKKVGAPKATSRIERDAKGREVLITIDENGNEKRKVRKTQEPETKKGHGLLMPIKDAKPLGMEVPDIPKEPEEEQKDVDIFDDAGDDYDPLAGLDDEDEDENEDEVNGRSDAEDGELLDDTGDKKVRIKEDEKRPVPGSMAPPPKPFGPRNYFGSNSNTSTKDAKRQKEDKTSPNLNDPMILAALKKASTLNPLISSHMTDADDYDDEEGRETAAKEAKRRKMLQRDDRDAMDMDMGFGSSKFADEEDFEEKEG